MSTWRDKKTGRWFIRVKHQGKYYSPGKGFDKKEGAQEADVLLKRSLRQGKILIAQGTFYEAWVEYLNHCKSYNGKDWYDAKRYIGYAQFKKWFDRRLDEIGEAELQEHFAIRKVLSPRSANLDFEILRNFFKWCQARHYLNDYPMPTLHKFSIRRKVKAIPEKDQIKKLIESTEGKDKLLILLLVCTMGRISEIRRLTWQDVDLKKKILYLRTRKTRDGSEEIREIPIHGSLLQCFHSLPANQTEGFVLSSNASGSPYKDLRKRLKRCLERANIQTFSFHAFRHYGASRLADSGVPLNVLQELLGHHDIKTTSIYLQTLKDAKRKAIEQLQA
jgi:integrase